MFTWNEQMEKAESFADGKAPSADGNEASGGPRIWRLAGDGGFELELSCPAAAGVGQDGRNGKAAAGGKKCPELESALEIKTDGATAAVALHAFQPPCEPLFGPQPYLDGQTGVAYTVRLSGADRFMAVYQHKNWWIRPAFPARLSEVPERTQLLLAGNGTNYLAILAVCGDEYRTDIAGSCSEGRERSGGEALEGLRITVASNCGGRNRADSLSLVFAAGENPYLCCEQAVKRALALLGRGKMFRKERRYPEMFEYFGWCSWDAFYHEVTQEGILEKLGELNRKRIPARWVLIDDGWLDADYKRQVLKGLDADAGKFPEGLSSCVEKLKKEYGVEQVGVWHAVMGYWNGLEEGSVAHKALEHGARRLQDGRVIPAAEAGKAFSFYDTWHEYLENHCGIDFVKVDGQSAISLFYEGRETYGEASKAVQRGLNASAAVHFDNRIINCMGMAAEDMWNRPNSALSRSSDDFVPDVPHGFREHAIQNGYNSLLQGQFFWGDWDMFWSDHEENWQNSILRAVSGGPVYTSDRVDRTDGTYILPLLKKDGRLIRCEEVGMPTADCLFENPVDTERVLKLFNRYGDAYVVAAFNIHKEDRECTGCISVTDIPALAGGAWYVYSYRGGEAFLLTEERDISFRLGANGAELFVLVPAGNGCHAEKGAKARTETAFRPLGILEKYIGLGCLEWVSHEADRTLVLLSEGGTFGFISEREPQRIRCGGMELSWDRKEMQGGHAALYRAACGNAETGSGGLLEIEWRA